jgi:hypothetical protein
MRKVLFLCFVLCSISGYSQSNWQRFKKLSCAEKTWTILHVFKAKKAYVVAKEAQHISDSIAKTPLLDGDKSGGQVDAFRHAYWMARLHQEIGKRAARSLGKAHEKANYQQYKNSLLEDGEAPDKVSSEMDLYNNDIGLNFTQKGVPHSKDGLIYKIVNAILTGKLKTIKKDSKQNYLTCDDKLITQKELKGKWRNNKCLMNSNYITN